MGGCQDVSLIIDFLASYLFPSGERVVEEWITTGISLGGNLTWRLLQSGMSFHYPSYTGWWPLTAAEPRIKIAIPIIGLPWDAFHLYLGARARDMGLEFAPPLYPPSLKSILETPRRAGCYAGKKILSIHGSIDTLVPFDQGKLQIEAAQREIEEQGGKMEIWVKEAAGHVVTTDMVRRVGDWVWRFALSS